MLFSTVQISDEKSLLDEQDLAIASDDILIDEAFLKNNRAVFGSSGLLLAGAKSENDDNFVHTQMSSVQVADSNATYQPTPRTSLADPVVKQKVISYFSDIPVMIEVARCESTFRQYGRDGDVQRGLVNSSDVGVMQINEYYHLEASQRLGLNIYTTVGNMQYARWLYEREGLQPWVSSRHCWGPLVAMY
jgi:hypothetical protein